MRELYVIQCNDDPYCAPYAEKICLSLEDAVKEASTVDDFARIELFSGSGNILESAERFWNEEGREIDYNGLPVYQVGDKVEIYDDLTDKIRHDPKVYNQGRDEIDDGQEPDDEKIAKSIKYIMNNYNLSKEEAIEAYKKATYSDVDEDIINQEIEECLKNAGVEI